MTSCILTVIKNEHLYLDEWLKYHLSLGVFHIFILEDLSTKSHSTIVNKYVDKVTLLPALSILSDVERQLVLTNRAQNIPGGQKTYIKAGLRYIQQNYNYDWCFVIDNDEFLTTQNTTLNNVLTTFLSYDAFIMSWQCYGANGLIKQPDYDKQGVIETFTQPASGYVPATSYEHNKKICYNLHTFNDKFWSTIHVPTEACNYCNTACQKDKITVCYNEIYIRHYITKSWEEYTWKKKTRGYFYGARRTPDAFFTINPDLLELKKPLLAETTLVVLPYSQRGSQGNELRLALTCWKKFCQFNYQFIIIGDYAKELVTEYPWITFIPFDRISPIPDQYYAHLDIQHKMEEIYNRFHLAFDGFIWMVDDNYAIRPFDIADILQSHYLNPTFTGMESAPTTSWKHDKWKTRQLLDAEKLPYINYTTHYPCYFSFEKLKQLWDKYNLRHNSYVVEDIYFNTYHPSTPIPVEYTRYGIWGPEQMGAPLEAALADPNIKFLCNSVEGWSPELEQILSNLILEPNP